MSRPAHIFRKYLLPVLVAFSLAVIIWSALRQKTSHETTIEAVPIEIKTAEDMAVLELSPETLDISFQGSQEDLRLLDRKQVKVVLDLKGTQTESEITESIQMKDIKGGSGSARPTKIKPSEIRFKLDRKTEKSVPVKPRVIGKPLFGEVYKTECEPAVVTVKGPEQFLAGLDLLHTEPLDVDGRVADFAKAVRVVRPEGGWVSEISQSEIRVTVKIKEQSEIREIKDAPVLALLRPDAQFKATVTPARVDVRLSGHPDALDKALRGKVRVFVDCFDLEPGPYQVPLLVSLDSGVSVAASTEPKFVSVDIERP